MSTTHANPWSIPWINLLILPKFMNIYPVLLLIYWSWRKAEVVDFVVGFWKYKLLSVTLGKVVILSILIYSWDLFFFVGLNMGKHSVHQSQGKSTNNVPETTLTCVSRQMTSHSYQPLKLQGIRLWITFHTRSMKTCDWELGTTNHASILLGKSTNYAFGNWILAWLCVDGRHIDK